MVIDNKQHQEMLLALIASANIKGEFLKEFYELMLAIQSAEIENERIQSR